MNFLNSDNIIHSGSYLLEGRKFEPSLTEGELRLLGKALKADPMFARIWWGDAGKRLAALRLQVSIDDRGRLLYNGKLYNRDSWVTFFVTDERLYGPPKIIRGQGRLAKEVPDVRNNHPDIVFFNEDGKPVHSDHCQCGGELVMDSRYYLYCRRCNLIYE